MILAQVVDTLAVCGVTLSSLLVASWRLGSRLARIESDVISNRRALKRLEELAQ